jgi:hypothetical protein
MNKKIMFFILFAMVFVLSGCSIGLTAKDKLDIADGIKTVHVQKNIPDVWKSENGMDIAISHEGFAKRADGNYCMTASVTVGGEQYMPPTYLCNLNGEWKPVAKITESVQPSVVVIPKKIEIKTAIVPIKKTASARATAGKAKIRKQSVVQSHKVAVESEFPLSLGTADKILHSRRDVKFTEIK